MNQFIEAVSDLLQSYDVIPKSTDGKLCCAECGAPLHRFERFTIIAVRHRDCRDTKMVGQQSLLAKGNQ